MKRPIVSKAYFAASFLAVWHLGNPASAQELKLPESELIACDKANLPGPVKQAGERVQRLLIDNMHCSGQDLSGNGSILLTNLHCLEPEHKMEVREKTGGLSTAADEVRKSSQVRFTGQAIIDPTAMPVDLKPKELLERFYRANGRTESHPRLLAAGKGYFIVPPFITDTDSFRKARAAKDDWLTFQEDYALFEMPALAGQGPGCLKLAETDPPDGERLWLVGYPEGLPEDELRVKMVSSGRAYRSIGAMKKALLPEHGGALPEEAWVDEKRFLHANLRVRAGMSGGAVLNEKGEMAGMLLAGMRPNQALILRASYLRQALRKRLGEEKFAKLTSCSPENEKAVKTAPAQRFREEAPAAPSESESQSAN